MSRIVATSGVLRLTCYTGDSSVLLAMDVDQGATSDLAGFAIQCVTPPGGLYPSNKYFLKNFLNLPGQPTGYPHNLPGSDKAPFQAFHWVHFPSAGPGKYQYTCFAAYFNPDGSVKLGPSASVKVNLSYKVFSNLELGFTRGYISSQAYADRFQKADIRPTPKSTPYDTAQYLKQYEWLGAHARQELFDFLGECLNDPTKQLDVFSFDFDEPDILNSLCQMGQRVRVFQDDSKDHNPSGLEWTGAVPALQNSGVQVKTGHFTRFAHDKVMIQKDQLGNAVKVLTGSANFSIRGMYVQANSVLVFSNPAVAALYEQAFTQAWNDETSFKASQVASKWYDFAGDGLPQMSISFAPHSRPTFSLDKVADAIKSSKSSVLFAIMQPSGGGPVMTALQSLYERQDILSLGTIQSKAQVNLFRQTPDVAVTSFAFLQNNIPAPFKQEVSGGLGQVIHHKFVVIDFNGPSPVAFCGSSNLAQGGEENNGDNLMAIYDPRVATYYAIEAIRLFDHYKFRSKQEDSQNNGTSMSLDTTDQWTKPYYDPSNIKCTGRTALCPTNLKTHRRSGGHPKRAQVAERQPGRN